MKLSLSCLGLLLLAGCAKPEVNPKFASAPLSLSPLAVTGVSACLVSPNETAGSAPVSQAGDAGANATSEMQRELAKLGADRAPTLSGSCGDLRTMMNGSFEDNASLAAAVRAFVAKQSVAPQAVLVPVVASRGTKCTQDSVRMGSGYAKTGTLTCWVEHVDASLLVFSASGSLVWRSTRSADFGPPDAPSLASLNVSAPFEDLAKARGPQATEVKLTAAATPAYDPAIRYDSVGVRITLPTGWVERREQGAASKALMSARATGADEGVAAMVLTASVPRGTSPSVAMQAQVEELQARGAEWEDLETTPISRDGLTGIESNNRHLVRGRDGTTTRVRQTLRLFIRGETELLISTTWPDARGARPASATAMLNAVEFPGPR